MNKTFQQKFEENLNKGLEYTLHIGSERWSISKMRSSGLYFLEGNQQSEVFEKLDELVFYLLLNTDYRSWQ